MKPLGMLLLATAAVLALAGVAVLFADRIPWLGRLPGDLRIEGRRGTFAFPIVTCLVVSVLLTVVLNVLLRLFRR